MVCSIDLVQKYAVFIQPRGVDLRTTVSANKSFLIAVATLMLCLLDLASAAADWPTYRGNQSRSGWCESDVTSLTWKPAWDSTSQVRPQPAWPAPARASLWQNLESISARQREDLADVPLIVNDKQGMTHVVVGFSGEDCVRSYDAVDGSVNWEVPLRAPVRFAPVIDNEVVYFGCDDGLVRAISLHDGGLVWQTRVGPNLPWIFGNGRMISPHPIRTSLLLFEDKIIANAGLFPSQGVYAVALNRETGEVIWRRKMETSPQGYLLAGDDGQGVVPTGRAQPYLIDLFDGEFVATLPSPGGSFCMLTQKRVYTGPGNENQVGVAEHDAEKQLVTFQSQAIVSTHDMLWTADGSRLACYRESDLQAGESKPIWSVPSELSANLIIAGNEPENLTLFLVGGGNVHVYDAATGNILQELAVENQGEQLIHVACLGDKDNAILAATSTSGSIYVWTGDSKNLNDQAEHDQDNDWGNAKKLRFHQAEVGIKESDGDGEASALAVKLKRLTSRLPCPVGLGLFINVGDLKAVQAFLNSTDYQLIIIAKDEQQQNRWRQHFLDVGEYGRRVCVWPAEFLADNSFEPRIFNVVVVGGEYSAVIRPDRFCADDGFLVFANEGVSTAEGNDEGIVQVRNQDRGGVWRHLYASPDNSAAAEDSAFAGAVGFRLHWFGGVGPRQIPDRHLRGAAPLVAGSSMVVHGDGCLIGVDPANGLERWQVQLPEGAMRYVIPFDSGYSCLSKDGVDFFVAANSEIWQIDPKSGQIQNSIPIPARDSEAHWGYLSEVQGSLFATVMRSSAPRYSQDRVVLRESFINDDYNSGRPLVCSSKLVRMSKAGAMDWEWDSKGVIPNSSISIDDKAKCTIFVESTAEEVQDRQQARFTTAQLLRQGALVCLDAETGEERWRVELDWPEAENMLYTLISDDCVVLVSSKSENEKAIYLTKVFDLNDGSLKWEKRHVHVREGLFHGEQVHHPVALKRTGGGTTLVVEPFMYDLLTSVAVVPAGMPQDWLISRPGHSCGTITGAADCLFFRANNPTAFNLNASNSQQRFTKLSPSRPSCWINMVPAAGRLFIPEGSASCVCQYSLQTSMAFTPVKEELYDQHFLDEVLPSLAPDG